MGLIDPNLGSIVTDLASLFRPPERLSVAEASERYVFLDNKPGYVGPYLNSKAPYMVEPMDITMSREYTAEIFAGPAQSAKTQALVLNTIAYIVKCNPMDVILYHMSQAAARDFSKRRIDRMHRQSEEVGKEVLGGQHGDNTHDKTYKSGMLLNISWPAISEMSSKPVPIIMFTDYDRMPEDIDGEGSPFILGSKRATTFRNLGMTIVESSPGRIVEAKDQRQKITGHEAPPCTGILSLYNQGDRRRWFWPCPECGEHFEGSFSTLTWDTFTEVDGEKIELDISEMAKSVKMVCPHCHEHIDHTKKKWMNAHGRWLREGEKIRKDGTIFGKPRYSKTASFWLKGPAATFITWEEMVTKYLNALRVYEQTGEDKDLKATINTDQGEPYYEKTAEAAMRAEDLQSRARYVEERMVPQDVRCLFACIDVQKNRFEVQVMGVRPGAPYDCVIIDRFRIEKSKRTDGDGDKLWVKPASYPEDWDLLTEQVLQKSYPIEDSGGAEMKIVMSFCDSGGSKSRNHDKKSTEVTSDMSVTSNAYNYYRRLREAGLADRFILVKGTGNMSAPRAHITFPDSDRKDRHANARGEIPVLFLNTNSLKDTVYSMLQRTEPGGGMIDMPSWLPFWFFEELVAEVRTEKGWHKLGSRRNEAFDLLTYFVGACVIRKVEKVDWEAPPKWLAPWKDDNPFVVLSPGQAPSVDKSKSPAQIIAQLGEQLA